MLSVPRVVGFGRAATVSYLYMLLVRIVQDETRAVTVACGEAHSAAVTAAGELYCWGKNDKMQLGIDHSSKSASGSGSSSQTATGSRLSPTLVSAPELRNGKVGRLPIDRIRAADASSC